MSYVIFHKETTILFGDNKTFKTIGAAKSAITRAVTNGDIIDREKYGIAGTVDFRNNIEKQMERTNLMSGEKYTEAVNTPAFMSPSCESYWSM